MSHHRVDDPVLSCCLSLWNRGFERVRDKRHVAKLAGLIILWAVTLIAGLGLALQMSICIGSAVLLPGIHPCGVFEERVAVRFCAART